MSDLIERRLKVLADALDGCPLTYPCDKLWSPEGWCKDHCKAGQQEPDAECWLRYAEVMVKEAKNSKESSLTQNALDTISRQAAIDVLGVGKEVLSRVLDETDDVVGCEREKYLWGLGLIEAYINDMKELPPAQPEQLTDKEQRIFLAAMGREEKVCKEVDDGYRQFREPYEDSLVSICHEITRKVIGALWTI